MKEKKKCNLGLDLVWHSFNHCLTLLLVLFLLASCTPQKPPIESYLGFAMEPQELSSYLQEKIEDIGIPGLSFALINEGEVVFYNTYGYANLEEQLAVDENTIFEGASISKSVFGFFAMTFVDAGLLDLDRPLFEYLPNPDLENDPRYKEITARMVLSHQSGLPNWREDDPENKLRLLFDPGTSYNYSGEGYQYLAEVLKELADTDWQGLDERFRESVAAPLQMEHTVFVQTPYTRANKAEPYDEKGNRVDWEQDYWYQKNDSVFVAPASIHSEAREFSKWMIGVMNEEILTQESYRKLLQPQALVEQGDNGDVYYTLGFFNLDIPGTDIYFHGGNNQGFTSWFALDTTKKWGFVLFTNSEYGEQLGNELMFYLITGPDTWKLYLIIGLLLLVLLLGIVWLFRYFRKHIRSKS
ncbi:serine hydrolase domain-containing protein [Croceiramulus getboli]|nr:serine hydrolase [Flavobacteriaceae bacterium YJPT1-3]